MSEEGGKGSLLQSILNARSRIPELLKRHRLVENARDSSENAAIENTQHEEARESRPPIGDAAEVTPHHSIGRPHKKPRSIPRSMESKSFYSAASLRLQDVEERVLRFLAGLRQRVASKRDAIPWRQFPTQQAAFAFADAQDPGGETLRTFSVELASSGKRKFLVTSYIELWRRYSAMVPHHRHYYEIIRQGSPCHLYFDLEYKTAANPGRDCGAGVDATLCLLREVLADTLDLTMEDSWVVELDSSTQDKFSRHILVRVPGAAFADNAHVGGIVAEVCARAWGSAAGQRREAMIFRKLDGEEALLIDGGVYSRNRAFRLHLSSKSGGGGACLRPTGRFACAGLTPEHVFMAALVCNVPPEALLLRCPGIPPGTGTASSCLATTAKQAMQRALQDGASTPCGAADRARMMGSVGHPCYGPTRHPDLDTFIESVCREGGSCGQIRSWVELDSGAVLLYNIKGNRYCGNIGRQHRSNGIFVVVDLQQGVWYQKCYDPDCRQYRSPVTPLPQTLQQHLCSAQEGGAGAGGGDEKEGQVWGDAAAVATWDDAALAAVQSLEGGH